MQAIVRWLVVSALLMGQSHVALGGQLRRIWMQDHCHSGVCSGVVIGRNDYVIMSQDSAIKHIMLTFINSSIAKVPHLMFDTFPDLQVLRMENCSVEAFEKPQFEGASNLMSLFLGHNLLRDIPGNIFLGADNLHTLMLNDNRLVTLHNNSFRALRELTHLSLEGNQLEVLPRAIFGPLHKLLILNLARNKLEVFPRGLFDANLNLTQISFAGNRFKVFESALLKAQRRLSLLDVSQNVLQELTLSFDDLETVVANGCDLRLLIVNGTVRELELRNNSLREVPTLPNAANITSLDLSLNPLGVLTGNPFRRFTALERLNLSATGIHDLDEGIFRKQVSLKLLDISSNSLYSLKFVTFENLKNLQYFYFHQNNWNCDFLQLLMTSFVKRRDISFMEDTVAPELVDDYIDGIACWHESKADHKCTDSRGSYERAADELAIVRNDISRMVEMMDKKFIKVYRLLEEMKLRL